MVADLRKVHAAAVRIAAYVERTPVFTSQRLDELSGCRLYFKGEHLQKTGSFKSRGAVNAVMSLSDDIAAKGVATHSSGNHGAAVARAAALRQIPAYVVVPHNAKEVKKLNIQAHGAQIIECEPTLAARESVLGDIVGKTGATFVPPFNHPDVMAGQGTAVLELINQVVGLDAIITPVGGGGLLSGAAIVAASAGIPVYGAEPAGADDAYHSFHSGERVVEQTPHTIADGLQTTLGELTFNIIKEHVTDILVADDEDIVEAMRLIYSRLKQVVEPSSAITLAVLLKNKELFSGKRVGLVLTGGNVDLDHLPF